MCSVWHNLSSVSSFNAFAYILHVSGYAKTIFKNVNTEFYIRKIVVDFDVPVLYVILRQTEHLNAVID